MSLSVLIKLHNNKYQSLQAAKWLKKNLNKSPKTVEELKEDITQFENNLNEDLLLNRNKCPHCKIEMATLNNKATVECPKCGLADTKLLMKDYHKFTNSYQEPSKQTFDHEKHFATWINNILGINTPREDLLRTLRHYIKKNNISTVSVESLRLILKRLKKAKYYKYTSYFYKQLTGIEMPFIPRDTISRAKWYFNKFYNAREKLVVEGKLPKNNPQYPYLVYKIFDLILDDEADEEKRRILQFIHLPSKSTLLKRNQEWNLILMTLF